MKNKEQILSEVDNAMKKFQSDRDIDQLKETFLILISDVEAITPNMHDANRYMLELLKNDCRNPKLTTTIVINPYPIHSALSYVE